MDDLDAALNSWDSQASTSTKQPKCTWRKNRDGEWVIFGPAETLRVGATVTVSKKNGEADLHTIQRVSRPFDVDGVPHVYAWPQQDADECIECGEPLRTAAQKRSGYCRPDCG